MKSTLVLVPPGNNSFSITLLIVFTQVCRYPESIAGLETSITKTNVGGMGGLFMYSLDATKSTEPFFSSFLSSKSCL